MKFKEINPSPRTLMTPGPVEADPRVLRAMSAHILGQFDPEFTALMNETMEMERYLFQTKNKQTYVVNTAFFGPIFAVLITDYFILHKRKITEEYLKDLYDENGNHAGVNWAAILAIGVGAVIGLLNVDISFFTATIPTGLVYYFGMKYMKSCKKFRTGTILEEYSEGYGF